MSYLKLKNKITMAEKKIEKTDENITLDELRHILLLYRSLFLVALAITVFSAMIIYIYFKPTIFSAQVDIIYLNKNNNELIVQSRAVIRDKKTLKAAVNRLGKEFSVASLQKDVLITKLPEENKVTIKATGFSEEQAEDIVKVLANEYKNIMENKLTKNAFSVKLVYGDTLKLASSAHKIIDIVIASVGVLFLTFLAVLLYERYRKK